LTGDAGEPKNKPLAITGLFRYGFSVIAPFNLHPEHVALFMNDLAILISLGGS
jgi:hypothetical protein